jgi:glycosyltransferase involved in cell wall biosynthesis
MAVDGNARLIRVFVHLGRGFGARHWEKIWSEGRIIGINERLPYGYFRASDDGCAIVYSEDKIENWLERFFRRGIAYSVRVDIVHAWRNRTGIYDSEIVWTHTEQQYLAVLILFRIFFWKRRPKLIAQSVWLFDRWQSLSLVRRWLYTGLIAKADILTVLSPENLKVARSLFPHVRSELILFGINADEFASVKRKKVHDPVRILSVGNDPDRDWQVLIRAIKDYSACYLKIVSRKLNKRKELITSNNIELVDLFSDEKIASKRLLDLFYWADMVVLTMRSNLHASGITVLQEAAIRGVPVICSDTGGLKAYFPDEEVYFIPLGDPLEIRKAIAKLAGDDHLRWQMAEFAQARMKTGGLNSLSYARRHAEISRELLAREPMPAARACQRNL